MVPVFFDGFRIVLDESVHARLGDLAVLEGAHAADAKTTDDGTFAHQWHAAFRRDDAGQGEVDQPSARHCVFRSLGRALESDGSVGFGDGGLDAAELRVVAALQIEQMATVIHHGDDHLLLVVARFSFGRGSHTLRIFESEYRLGCHIQSPNTRKT